MIIHIEKSDLQLIYDCISSNYYVTVLYVLQEDRLVKYVK